MNKLEFSTFNWLALKVNNESLKRHLNVLKGLVIDLGCGTSQYKKDILEVSQKYIGVDWENGLHDQSNVDVFADLAKELPFDDNFADSVTSFQVMEHLPEPDFFLSECFRILKPGGALLITVPFMWHVHEAPHDFYRYTRFGLEYLLKKNNFAEIQIEENTGFWQMWALKVNYQTTRFARGPSRYLFIPVWWLTQTISPWLDKIDWNPQEAASYTVVAKKP